MAEKFISYSEDVDSIPEAFSFVMEHMDEFASPNIVIQPYTSYESISDLDDDDKGEQKFGVVVSGNVE